MIYTTYNPTTGEIYSIITTSNDVIPEVSDNVSIIPGAFDSQTYRIADGIAVELPVNPSNQCQRFQFDYTSKSWQLDSTTSTFLTRDVRNKLLQSVDKINPIWYASLTADQQQQLADYRLALLAVPQQPDFPATVSWPVKPTWLL